MEADDRTLTQAALPRSDPSDGGRFSAGARIGPYCLLRFLGRGAFGEVWLAERDSAIAKSLLAVKLPLHAGIDLSIVRKEAEVWVRAGNHPNVLPLFEANVYDGQVVIVSEYAPDGCLKQWLGKHGGKAPSFDVAVDMAMAVLAGLEHLHVRSIVHRDLKPANVLMQGECPRIADFGLARVLDPRATVSLAAGTPAYMAPEAFDGQRTVQTDLWAVGVMLYQMLGGGLPFPSDDLMRLMKAIAMESPAPLSESVPSALRQTVFGALDKDPDSRFRTAADMRSALRDTLRRLETAIVPASQPPQRGCRTIAVTGSLQIDPRRAAHRIQTLTAPYRGPLTTWYCGSIGVVDHLATEFLLHHGQRVIAVGRDENELTPRMAELLREFGGAFVDASTEQVPDLPDAPSKRDIFLAVKSDLLIILWNGHCPGIAKLLNWLRTHGKDHIIGFV